MNNHLYCNSSEHATKSRGGLKRALSGMSTGLKTDGATTSNKRWMTSQAAAELTSTSWLHRLGRTYMYDCIQPCTIMCNSKSKSSRFI